MNSFWSELAGAIQSMVREAWHKSCDQYIRQPSVSADNAGNTSHLKFFVLNGLMRKKACIFPIICFCYWIMRVRCVVMAAYFFFAVSRTLLHVHYLCSILSEYASLIDI